MAEIIFPSNLEYFLMISVIIPVYNLSKYIEKCLFSISNQSYKNFEVIIVDDGSSDESYLKCIEFKNQNNSIDIKIIKKTNEGVTAARRDGVRIAKGDWITFVDGDDTLPENALENLIKECFSKNVNIIIGAYNKLYEDGTTEFCPNLSEGIRNSFEYIDIILKGQFESAPWGKLFRKEIFSEFIFDLPSDIKNKEDAIMNLRIAVSQKRNVIFINKPVYNYFYDRIGSARNIYSDKFNIDYEIKILDYFTSSIAKSSCPSKHLKGISMLYMRNLWGWRKKNNNLNQKQILRINAFSKFIVSNNVNFLNVLKIIFIYIHILRDYLKHKLRKDQNMSLSKKK